MAPDREAADFLLCSGLLLHWQAMHLDELDYELPPELIAQRPLTQRDASRMLVLNRENGSLQDRKFSDFPELLEGNELLVLNNARVLPARLFGRRVGIRSQPPSRATRREHLTGTIEVLLTRQLEKAPEVIWEALVRPGRKIGVGERVLFGKGALEGEVTGRGERGLRQIRFTSKSPATVEQLLEELGHVPLPPYIERADEMVDRERYQTVFAKRPGAVAAPTAGLHFTKKILEKVRARGAEICELTLDVGLGTFQPIHEVELEKHKMHAEAYEIPIEAAERIHAARESGRKIVAIGTTVVRALENSALLAEKQGKKELVLPGKGEALLFITPGFRFRVVDTLLTNFHLPRSTLLALVCAFAGRDKMLAAYRHAIQERYRFYSYGDCMLIR